MEAPRSLPARCYGTKVRTLVPRRVGGPIRPRAWRLLGPQDVAKITGYSPRWIRELVRRGDLPAPGYLTPDLPRWDPDQLRERLESLGMEWPKHYRMRRPPRDRKLTVTQTFRAFHVGRTTFFQRHWFQEPGKGFGKRIYWTAGQIYDWWEEQCGQGRGAVAAGRG
jgi:predicted DNA-binding transcriptional regulator AlpA